MLKEEDLSKLGLNVFTGEKEIEIADKMVLEILPKLNGYTINQIELAFSKCTNLIKSCKKLD